MKFLTALLAVAAMSLGLAPIDAEAAKRLGGGKSLGMQRQATPPAAPAAAPGKAPATAGGAPAAAPKRSWMGPIAGLAAGLGLAALASHLGFGEELASMMMMGLLAVAVIAVIGFIMRKRAMAGAGSAGNNGLRYAGAGTGPTSMARNMHDMNPPGSSSANPVAAMSQSGHAPSAGRNPADFDAVGFARNAKVNFIRLQAANDAGNLDDIKEFTTPEMFAEIKMDISERNGATQTTDVVSINADVIDVEEQDGRYVVSVRFTGMVRDADEPQPQAIDEIWHLTKPKSGAGGWTLAGIQQTA